MKKHTIRKVKVLKGKAKEEAEKQGLKPDDLVIVTGDDIEKVKGDPVSYLLGMDKPKPAKCLYAPKRFCWQTKWEFKTFQSSVKVIVIDESKCAACIAARINYGNNALRCPRTKEELKEFNKE